MGEFAQLVEELEELLRPIPGTQKIREELGDLRRLILEQRAPRFALVGRRGSGKSSLVNAIFGQQVAEVGHTKAQTGRGRWWTYEGELGNIEILDTRGLQEGSRPEGEDESGTPLDSIVTAIGERLPDAVLFLVKAKEVDAAIDADIAALVTIRERLKEEHMPIVAIITHVDELEPKNIRLHESETEHAEDIAEKLRHVQEVQRHLEDKIREHSVLKKDLVTVIGVSSYMSWRSDGSLRADERWRIEDLVYYLANELPDEAQVSFARLSRMGRVQRRIANRLTNVVSGLCGGIAATPLPVADIAPITSLQVSLVAGIAYISGREMNVKTAAEFMTAMGLNVGIGFGLREVARALLKTLAPGPGTAASAAIAAAATYAIGRAATTYFLEGASIDAAKASFEVEMKNDAPKENP